MLIIDPPMIEKPLSRVIKVRASSISTLFDCAYKWEGIHILGMKGQNSSRAALGTAIHAGTAAYDQAMIDDEPISIDQAVDAMLVSLTEAEVDWRVGDLSFKQAMYIATILINRYCTEIAPLYEFSSVEMPTQSLLLNCGDGVVIDLCGTLDRSRIIRGVSGYGIGDIKTGKGAVSHGVAKTKGHKAQMGAYEILFEETTGEEITLPADILGLKTSNVPEVGIGSIENSKELLIGTDENKGLIEYAAAMFKSGDFYPNPNSGLCSDRYCPRWAKCPYHE